MGELQMTGHELAAQAACPTGELGLALCRLMDTINAETYARAISLAWGVGELHRQDVLDVGFGGAGLLRRITAMTTFEFSYLGVDSSPTVVDDFNAHLPSRGGEVQAHAICSPIETVALARWSFDVAFALNTLYWWTNPSRGLQVIRRTLRPDGALVLGVAEPTAAQRAQMAQLVGAPRPPRYFTPVELRSLLHDAHFYVVDSDSHDQQFDLAGTPASRRYHLILAEKS